jgi:hypothetical protein
MLASYRSLNLCAHAHLEFGGEGWSQALPLECATFTYHRHVRQRLTISELPRGQHVGPIERVLLLSSFQRRQMGSPTFAWGWDIA